MSCKMFKSEHYLQLQGRRTIKWRIESGQGVKKTGHK